MTYLIIVEGITDKGVVQKITEKLNVKAEILLMRGNRPSKASHLVNAKLVVKNYSKVMVLKDQHEHPEDKILEKLTEITRNVQHPKTYPIMVKKAIEAWILAGMGVPNPENIDNPEEHLDHILQLQGKRYVKTLKTAKKLAENINPQQASQHSNTLKQFIKALKDP